MPLFRLSQVMAKHCRPLILRPLSNILPIQICEPITVEKEIDWANLSPEDKEVFFSWLDEFFANFNAKLSVKTDANVRANASPATPFIAQAVSSSLYSFFAQLIIFVDPRSSQQCVNHYQQRLSLLSLILSLILSFHFTLLSY